MNSHPRTRAGASSGWSARRAHPGWRLALFLIACGLAMATSSWADALGEESVEYRVKLAFIHNFTKFVEWPASSYSNPDAPLVIYVVGTDPFNADLEDELRLRKVGRHPLVIRNLKPGDAIGACQMVFISLSAQDQVASIVKGLKGSSTLTVSETQGFALKGGMINFAVEGHRVRLEVNPLAANRAGLKISSRLLNLATIVKSR